MKSMQRVRRLLFPLVSLCIGFAAAPAHALDAHLVRLGIDPT